MINKKFLLKLFIFANCAAKHLDAIQPPTHTQGNMDAHVSMLANQIQGVDVEDNPVAQEIPSFTAQEHADNASPVAVPLEYTVDEEAFDHMLLGHPLPYGIQHLDMTNLEINTPQLGTFVFLLPKTVTTLNLKVNNIKVNTESHLAVFASLFTHLSNLETLMLDRTALNGKHKNLGATGKHASKLNRTRLQNQSKQVFLAMLQSRGITLG